MKSHGTGTTALNTDGWVPVQMLWGWSRISALIGAEETRTTFKQKDSFDPDVDKSQTQKSGPKCHIFHSIRSQSLLSFISSPGYFLGTCVNNPQLHLPTWTEPSSSRTRSVKKQPFILSDFLLLPCWNLLAAGWCMSDQLKMCIVMQEQTAWSDSVAHYITGNSLKLYFTVESAPNQVLATWVKWVSCRNLFTCHKKKHIYEKNTLWYIIWNPEHADSTGSHRKWLKRKS